MCTLFSLAHPPLSLSAMSHDRMTEQVYSSPLVTYETGMKPKLTSTIPVMSEGRKAMEKINDELGLAFDDWDLDYYTKVHIFTVIAS